MEYKTIKENASITADTIRNLIRKFNIDFDDITLDIYEKFPTTDKYPIVYDKYYTVKIEYNTIHVFEGSAIDIQNLQNIL